MASVTRTKVRDWMKRHPNEVEHLSQRRVELDAMPTCDLCLAACANPKVLQEIRETLIMGVAKREAEEALEQEAPSSV